MNVVFFGSSSYVIPILEVLRKNFDLKLVVTTEHAKRASSSLALQGETLQPPVVKYCIQYKIPYFSVSSSSDLIHNSSFIIHDSPLAVLADFGLIIPDEILNAFPKGIINIHPSLLPKYRGPTPVQTAILNGEKTTGVSIIKLDEEVDHGPILAQAKEEILPTDNSEILYKRLFTKGANLLPKVLNLYLKDKLKPTAQNHAKATFTKSLNRTDGFVDLSSSSLEIKNLKLEIARKVRAYYPWPGVWFKMKLNDKEKIIKLLPNPLTAQQPNNPILIQVEGKKPVTYKDFLNGYPQARSVMSQILPISK